MWSLGRRISGDIYQAFCRHYNEARKTGAVRFCGTFAVHVVDDPLGVFDVPVSASRDAKQPQDRKTSTPIAPETLNLFTSIPKPQTLNSKHSPLHARPTARALSGLGVRDLYQSVRFRPYKKVSCFGVVGPRAWQYKKRKPGVLTAA